MRKVVIERRINGLGSLASKASTQDVLMALWRGRGLDQTPDYGLKTLLAPDLTGIQAASARLEEAIVSGEHVRVVGDFDADGATATALAVTALQAMGLRKVDWLIPDRFKHGYGLSEKLIEEMGRDVPDVILTVDQGISSMAGVALAKSKGIDVIITDHHLPADQLPVADAIVNPNLPGDAFPSKHLAGVGVVFYLMLGLRQRLRESGYFEHHPEPRMDQWLDLVALGTVADLVVLDHNNRVLVQQGMERIRSGRSRPGVIALLEIAGRNVRYASAGDLGYVVAPRLNAAGRLDDMGLGVRCLLAKSAQEARRYAHDLDQINAERKSLQASMQAEANEQAAKLLTSVGTTLPGACLFDPSWHQGVVGLVAGQLAERIQRPVVAFAPDEPGSSFLKGSARSPSGIHMRDLLVELDLRHSGLIERFGGHSGAAGLTLHGSQLEHFRKAFDQLVSEIPSQAQTVISDGPLAVALLSVDFAQALIDAGPWGQGFPEPLFDGAFEVIDRRVVGGSHLKLSVQPVGSNKSYDAIAFRAAELCHQELPQPWHITYRLELNRWQGRVSVQLNLQHWVDAVLASA